MKKSLLALAVLGAFASAASAQSSVTIYGQIDVGVAKSNGGTAPNAGAPAGSAWTVQQAHGSRLGFRGNEDLGGGMSAQFLIEHRLFPDTGLQNGASFWQGSSYVQLTSDSAGSVYLGRTYIPAFSINAKSDPFTLDGVGQVGSKGFANYVPVGGDAYRTPNTVGYKTPNLGGFTVNAAVALGEGATGRGEGINAEYTAGPLYVGAAYDKTVGGATSDGNSLINVGVAYDFKFIRPIFYYARTKTTTVTPHDTKNKLISVGLTAPLGAGVIKAVYYRLTPTTPTTELVENKAAVGYDYFLSKRTRLYADFSVAKKDTFTNNRAYNLGVRHDF